MSPRRVLPARWPRDPVEALLVASRTMGADETLVLRGGGNSSVKVTDRAGRRLLVIKGSGRRLATLDESGLAQVELDALLAGVPRGPIEGPGPAPRALAGPQPSLETPAHALIDARFVLHCHADAILACANQVDLELAGRILGPRVVVVPCCDSGWPLGFSLRDAREESPAADAVVIRHHGIFTWGESAEEALGLMLELVARAEAAIAECGGEPPSPRRAWPEGEEAGLPADQAARLASLLVDPEPFDEAAELSARSPDASVRDAPSGGSDERDEGDEGNEREDASGGDRDWKNFYVGDGHPADHPEPTLPRRGGAHVPPAWHASAARPRGHEHLALCVRRDARARRLVSGAGLAERARRMLLTPDHLGPTRRFPLVLEPAGLDDEARLREAIERWSEADRVRRGGGPTRRPRVVLVRGEAVIGAGTSEKAAIDAADIAEHALATVAAGDALGRYACLDDIEATRLELEGPESAV